MNKLFFSMFLILAINTSLVAQSRDVKATTVPTVTTSSLANKVYVFDPITRIMNEITITNFLTALTLTKSSVGLTNVDNTADVSKPVSTAQQTALDLKANLASPIFTGTVGVPKVKFGAASGMVTVDSAKIVVDSLFFYVGTHKYKAVKSAVAN